VFVEQAVMNLVSKTGFAGLLTPSGIATDNNSSEFFKLITAQKRLAQYIDFENKNLFPDVHKSFKFAISIISGVNQVNEVVKTGFFFRSEDDLSNGNFIELSAEDFALFNPNTRTMPIFVSQSDYSLTKKIYQNSVVLVDESKPTRPSGTPPERGQFHLRVN
jgi:hypothetical protein